MKKSKHMKENRKNYKKVIILLMIIIIAFLVILCKDRILVKETDKDQKENIILEQKNIITEEDTTIENQKLVLKSNYEENKERKIIYIFKENKLNEVRISEKYTNKESYTNEKEIYSKRADIEIIEIDDSQLELHCKKLNLGSDEGLSYEQVYQKYMGIIGAYEVI